jgi:hypothetical protein
MSFSKVVHDRLSAETADSDGEALFEEVSWFAGDHLALKVQAVDDNGDETSLTEDVFKAIKPQEVGTLLRFDFNGDSRANLRFSFGRYQDGEWTDVYMPWATITLMDFDCGSNRNKCEEVTSRDHSYYDAGNAVKVQITGDEVLFKDTIISNAENNPHNVILDDVQKSISVALFFENRNQFTLGMRNYAAWPRTILFAGITTMQWPEYQTPAPTPSPTPAPTPSPTPAPTATPSPTPAPTCPFALSSGSCSVVCDCISSPNYPQNYNGADSCEIDVLFESTLEVKDFRTEVYEDQLVVGGESYSGTLGPDRAEVSSTITWSTDSENHEKGWHICAVVPTPAPTPSPTPSPTVPLKVTSGNCQFDDYCVYSPHYPSKYDSSDSCSIEAQVDVTLHVVSFATEKNYDILNVDGAQYSGLTSPDLVEVSASSTMTWSTDWGTTHKGWRICVEEFTTTTPVIDVFAVGDPHVSSITGESFDLWRTGWSTFVQIPQLVMEDSAKFLVRGEVRPYSGARCAPAFLQQVHVNGSWLGHQEVSIHAGSLESSDPFHVTVNGGEPVYLNVDGETVFNLTGASLTGRVATDDPSVWGPDARVRLSVGDAEVNIVQHTEGRGESSSAMLDLSVSGLANIVDTIGGWLGVDGAAHAGQAPPECDEHLALLGVDRHRYVVNQVDGGSGGLSVLPPHPKH